jgi:hypothetical protein
MLENINTFDKNIIGFRLDGGIDKEEMARCYDEIEKKISPGEKFMLYAEVKNMSLRDVTWEAIKEEVRRLIKNPTFLVNISKAVIVTDIEWLRKEWAIESALIPTLEGASFSFGEEAKAVEWLRTDQRADKRLDVVMSELDMLSISKTAAGFGLGMLAAGLFSKSQRRGIGMAALIGSVAIGLPVGIKLLNNNRQLLQK